MEINNLSGAAAYANTLTGTPPVEDTQLRDQNIEAARTQIDSQTVSTAQEAFEVSLSREAQSRLAEDTEATEPPEATQTEEPVQALPPEVPNNSNPVPVNNTSQIVNIVA